MTDEQIIEKYVDLSSSDLNTKEKVTLMNIVKLHKEAFSLRDEIGKCPNIKIDIDSNGSRIWPRGGPSSDLPKNV